MKCKQIPTKYKLYSLLYTVLFINYRAMIHINVHKNTGNLLLNTPILKINLIVVSFNVTVSNNCVQLPSDLPPILYTYISIIWNVLST